MSVEDRIPEQMIIQTGGGLEAANQLLEVLAQLTTADPESVVDETAFGMGRFHIIRLVQDLIEYERSYPDARIAQVDADPLYAPIGDLEPVEHGTSREPTKNESVGMAWWNNLPEHRRAHWCRVANSAKPADAWAAYCRGDDCDREGK